MKINKKNKTKKRRKQNKTFFLVNRRNNQHHCDSETMFRHSSPFSSCIAAIWGRKKKITLNEISSQIENEACGAQRTQRPHTDRF